MDNSGRLAEILMASIKEAYLLRVYRSFFIPERHRKDEFPHKMVMRILCKITKTVLKR